MNKNYYAIIPANVRYDKDLTPNAKLLYGELTALSNEKGYCWASNSYFSELYGVSKKTVSNWIASLDEKGFVKSEMIYKENSKEIKERRLYINPMENNFATYGRNFPNPMENNFHTPMEKKVTDNNTVFNNTVFNNTRDIKNNVEQSPTVSIPYSEIVDYLNQKIGTQYRSTSKKTQSLIKSRFNEGFTLEDFKTVIDKKSFQWLNNSKMQTYLRPETLFGSKFEGYLNEQIGGYGNAKSISTHGEYDSSGRKLL
ncbi:MAG: conserved phage C-terminal domain-containing protein [Turicibacter sp.]|nr:conserved phage C-terminal domain-containing protein [Turicibacter sp.]